MKQRYYKITGLNEGIPIEPFGVLEQSLDHAIQEYGDMSRSYVEITKEEYYKLNPEEAQALAAPFKMVIAFLLDAKFEFTVFNPSMTDNEVLMQMVLEEDKQKDMLYLYMPYENTEVIVSEYDEETLMSVYYDLVNR